MGDPDLKEDPFFSKADVCWPAKYPGSLPMVRHQGRTNCCYAFAVVNCLYADLFKNGKETLKGSEQEFLDCLHEDRPPPYMVGKEGPVPLSGYTNTFRNALEYTKEKGIHTEEQYQWVGGYQGCKRRKSKADPKIFLEDCAHIRGSRDLVVKLLHEQPAVTGCIMFTRSFKKWNGTGIYQYADTERERMKKAAKDNSIEPPFGRHAITLVGFGNEDGKPYFLAQNSYGPGWGHKGYVKVLREDITHCYYPIGTHTQPSVMKRKSDGGDPGKASTDAEDAGDCGHPGKKSKK